MAGYRSIKIMSLLSLPTANKVKKKLDFYDDVNTTCSSPAPSMDSDIRDMLLSPSFDDLCNEIDVLKEGNDPMSAVIDIS